MQNKEHYTKECSRESVNSAFYQYNTDAKHRTVY